MIKKIFGTFTAILLATIIAGCSIFVPSTQTITINGQPAGAQVIVNGNSISAPGTVQVKRNVKVNIMVIKEGYNPYFMNSGYSLNTWGAIDIIGGFIWLVPFIGLAAPGAYNLDQESFYYVLTPQE